MVVLGKQETTRKKVVGIFKKQGVMRVIEIWDRVFSFFVCYSHIVKSKKNKVLSLIMGQIKVVT